MTRSKPKISPAQMKSLAAVSKVQAKTEAAHRNIDQMLEEFKRRSAETRREIAAQNAQTAKLAFWIPRLAALPLAAFSLLWFGLVFVGLWTGEIGTVGKYSKVILVREANPTSYWLSVAIHSMLATLLTYASVHCFRAAWSRRPEAT